jgi:hypothetical protein
MPDTQVDYNEDRDRIICCGSSTSAEWTEKFCQSNGEFHQNKRLPTADLVQHSWGNAMDPWLATSEDDIVVDPNLFLDTIRHDMVKHQNAIDWGQV